MTTYYVAPWGSDANPGSFTFPKRTIASALALVGAVSTSDGAGDSVVLRAGTYDEYLINLIPGGSSGNHFILAGYSGETAVLMPSTIPVNSGIIYWTANNVRHITIRNLVVDGSLVDSNGLIISHASVIANYEDLIVEDCTFQHIKGDGCDLNGLNNIIRRCLFKDIGQSFPGLQHGTYLTHFQNGIVEDNEFHTQYGYGIQLYPPDVVNTGNLIQRNRCHDPIGTAKKGGIVCYGHDNDVFNNIVYRAEIGINVSSSGNRIFNNTIFDCFAEGVFDQLGSGNFYRNNILYSNNPDLNIGTSTQSNNLTSNPSFVDSVNGDFHINAGSLAIDAGFNLAGIVIDDFDGNTRPVGAYDIGAYEFGATGGGGGVIETPPEVSPPTEILPPGTVLPPGSAGAPGAILSPTKRWLVLGRLYADSGLQAFASTRVRHPNWTYEPFVIDWGFIERNISVVSGLPEVSYATIELADNHRHWRDILSTETLRRRYFDLKLVPDQGSESAGETLFVGEVDDWLTEAGKVTFTLKDRLFAWLDEPIPAMLIRELYPDIPVENEGGFLPIIFGHCRSSGQTVSPPSLHKGIIPCPPYGPIGSPVTAFRYGLSMTRVSAVVQVYRSFTGGYGQEITELVDSSEYTVTEVDITAFNVLMHHQFLDFTEDQHGATITADVDGIYERGAYGSLAAILPGSPGPALRNPIDAWINMAYLIMSKMGIVLSVTDAIGISALRTQFEMGIGSPPIIYYCDGAITEPMTAREWLGQFLPCFNLFMPQNRHGLITLKLLEHENVLRPIISEGKFILRNSFKERPPETVVTQFIPQYQFNHSTKKFETWKIFDTLEQNVLGTLNASSPQIIQAGVAKDEVSYFFISDNTTAAAAVTARASFMALGSFRQEFAVPTPPTMTDIDLAAQIGLTHTQGLSLGGYIDEEVFITGITFDVKNLTYLCRSIRRIPQTLQNPLTQSPPTSPCPTFTNVLLITIDHTQLPNTETDFIVPIEITHADLKSVGNGGSVQSTNGFDIRPTLTTCVDLDYELDENGYDPVAGTLLMYVLLPLVYGSDRSVDTSFLLNFGNASLTTDGSTDSIWTGYNTVLHLNVISAGIGCTRDSTDFITAPTPSWHNFTTVTDVTSQIGNGGNFGGADYLRLDGGGPTRPFVDTQDGTIQFWLKTSTKTRDILGFINHLVCSSFNAAYWFARVNSNGTIGAVWRNHDGSQLQTLAGATDITDNVWHHVVITRSGTTTNVYVDGALDGTNTAAYTVNVIDDAGAFDVGTNTGGICSPFFIGLIDEMRSITDTAWTADRILAEYNAQANTKNPSSFYTVT